MAEKPTNRISRFIAAILPGIFLMGYNIGTGSITAMSKAGANFGLDLLWTVLLSCVITYYLILHFSKFTMVTGETIIEGIKKHIHPAAAIFLVCTLSFIILAALMGLLGLLGNVVSIWSGTWGFLDHAIPSAWACVGISVFLYLLLLVGRISFFEKVLAVLVAIMGVTFLYTMIISANSLELADFAKGFIPKIPDLAEGSDNSPGVIIAGMVGTTVSVFAFVIRSILVKQAGWTPKDYAAQKKDARISVALMFVISVAVMITAAATLFKSGLKVNNIGEMIPMLEPFFGAGALSLFVFGIIAAGLSSHLPNLLVIPWLLLDLKGGNRDLRSVGVRLTLLALTIWATVMASLGYKPVFIMMISQACISVVLPFAVGCLFFLTSKPSLMGDQRNRPRDMIALTLVMIFALYMSSLAIRGLIEDVLKNF